MPLRDFKIFLLLLTFFREITSSEEKKFALESSCINIITVFPRINARGVYFKSRDFRGAFIRGGRLFEGAFIRGGVYFKISKIVETGYGRTKIRKHSCPVISVICTATC